MQIRREHRWLLEKMRDCNEEQYIGYKSDNRVIGFLWDMEKMGVAEYVGKYHNVFQGWTVHYFCWTGKELPVTDVITDNQMQLNRDDNKQKLIQKRKKKTKLIKKRRR